MTKTYLEQSIVTPEDLKAFQQEWTLIEAAELINSRMKDAKVSRTELAKRIGKTQGYVTQILSGDANMTLRTLSDVFTALGCALTLGCMPINLQSVDSHATVTQVFWSCEKPRWRSGDNVSISGDAPGIETAFDTYAFPTTTAC